MRGVTEGREGREEHFATSYRKGKIRREGRAEGREREKRQGREGVGIFLCFLHFIVQNGKTVFRQTRVRKTIFHTCIGIICIQIYLIYEFSSSYLGMCVRERGE